MSECSYWWAYPTQSLHNILIKRPQGPLVHRPRLYCLSWRNWLGFPYRGWSATQSTSSSPVSHWNSNLRAWHRVYRVAYLVSHSPKMPVPNLLSSVINKPIIFNTSQLKAEISIVAASPGSLFSGHKYLLEIIQTSRPTDSPGSGKTITIVEAIMQLTKIAGE